jgi:hypothetical protein
VQKDKFYDVLRANHTNLTTQNVMGFEKCLDYALEHKFPLQFLKYVLATAYTGKDLDDSIDLIDESDDEDFREMVKARNIVNGKDRAQEIAKLGLRFERALKAGGYAY